MKKAAGIFFSDGKSLLLLKRADGKQIETWGIPGGKGHIDESETENAERETKEELGLKSIPGKCVASLSNKGGEGPTEYTAFIHRVEKPFRVNISKEHSDWKWVKLEDVKSQNLHPIFRENLPRYLKALRQKSTFSEWLRITDLMELQ